MSAYHPQLPHDGYLKFWGTRGSVAVSGGEYERFGGNTACLEICTGEDPIIIDAGSGIRPLGNLLMEQDKKTLHLLIGHGHWDHISGFPFFLPVYDSSFTLHIYGGKNPKRNLKETFVGLLEREYFPVKLDEMHADLHFHEFDDEHPLELGNLTLHAARAHHPGVTYCFKFAYKGRVFGYATDNEFLAGYHGHPCQIDLKDPLFAPFLHQIEFFQGCDTLIHEAQYTPEEYEKKEGWGHSSIANTAALIYHTGISHWIVTHHDPDDGDERIEEKLQLARKILRDCEINCRVEFAYDGYVFPL